MVHILSGYLALSCGAILMLGPKGNKLHRKLGRVFFYSMLGVCFSSIYLAVAKDIPFLFYIGIFVFYQNYAGFQSARNKTLKPGLLDGLVLLIALINGLLMISTLDVVLMVFGGISLFLVAGDLKIYYTLYRKGEISRLSWLARHIGMMLGAYIGAITAFLVVNVKTFEPAWAIWLAPTLLLVPLMQYWVWKYTRKPLLKSKTAKKKA